MRTPSASDRPPLSRSRAWNCLVLNQFATPGLGSLLARRYVAGTVQLLLAIAGFLMFVGWFVKVFYRQWLDIEDRPTSPDHLWWLGWGGALVFIVSWLLSWITSLSLLRGSQANAPPAVEPLKPAGPRIPPRITHRPE